MSGKGSRARDRMARILTKEELDRFTFLSETEHELLIRVDLHGLSCREARRLVKNTMLLIPDSFDLVAIHGYRHGQALKNMLWNDFEHDRVADRRRARANPGVTTFQVA